MSSKSRFHQIARSVPPDSMQCQEKSRPWGEESTDEEFDNYDEWWAALKELEAEQKRERDAHQES